MIARVAVVALLALTLFSWEASYIVPHGWTVSDYRHYGICALQGRIVVYQVTTTDLATSQRPGVGYVNVHVHEVPYHQLNPSFRGDLPMIPPCSAFTRPIIGSATIIAGGEAPSFAETAGPLVDRHLHRLRHQVRGTVAAALGDRHRAAVAGDASGPPMAAHAPAIC